ncbi:glycosyltransferase family 2 protein [Escherichia coli]|uniref:glycosyltransferase family 2 protein n=1 Tax=Escherichia coli TaxID=562 RepID=UPI003B223291
MKNGIDVSVIIPAYNAAETSVSLVTKILSEPHLAIELIIVDDGSTDETGNVLRQIHDDRLILIVKWFTEFGHLNRGDMLTSEQHRCHNEKKKFQRRV